MRNVRYLRGARRKVDALSEREWLSVPKFIISSVFKPQLRLVKPNEEHAKPMLHCIEVNLTDQCNMNCRGCDHFSPIAEPWYADPGRHEEDMRQLQKHFARIWKIVLRGGNPLLHPDLEQFLRSTREIWPMADIRLVTNGDRLTKMPKSFWESCRANAVFIDCILFPPMMNRHRAICDYAAAKGVTIRPHKFTWLRTARNFKGDSDPDEAFRRCHSRPTHPFLREGKIYICALSALAHYLNASFGTDIPADGCVDIYAPETDGRHVLDILGAPADTCRFCSCDFSRCEWGESHKDRSEWEAFSYENV